MDNRFSLWRPSTWKVAAPKLIEKASNFRTFSQLFGIIRGLSFSYSDYKAEFYIEDGYEGNPTVFSVVDFVGTKASTVPWRIDVQTPDGTFEPLQDPSHPLNQILKRPNQTSSWAEFVNGNICTKMILGESFTIGLRAAKNRPFTKLMLLPPQNVEIKLQDDLFEPIRAYRMTGGNSDIDPDCVMHRKYFNMETEGEDAYRGMSPLQPAIPVLRKDKNAYIAEDSAFKNMGVQGILTSESEYPLTPEEQKDAQVQYGRDYGGPDRFNEIGFSNAKLKFQSFGMSPVDLNIIESHVMSQKDLANVYHFPVTLLNNTESSTFNNLKEMKQSAWVDAIIPEMDDFKKQMQSFLVDRYSELDGRVYKLEYDLSKVPELQTDMEKHASWLLAAQAQGIINGDEVREGLGYSITGKPEHQIYVVMKQSRSIDSFGESDTIEGVSGSDEDTNTE